MDEASRRVGVVERRMWSEWLDDTRRSVWGLGAVRPCCESPVNDGVGLGSQWSVKAKMWVLGNYGSRVRIAEWVMKHDF